MRTPDTLPAGGPGPGPAPLVVDLRDRRAGNAELVGAKAANLARCAAAGLPVAPGVVVTTAATSRWPPGAPVDPAVLDELRPALVGLGDRRAGPLVVRSSSTLEDAEHSSMAGRFRSVLDVVGWEALVAAVVAVRDSAAGVLTADGDVGPLAVLIQPQVAAVRGGVLFGVDPVDGDGRHLVVEVTPGNPSDLVSGRATATHLVLSRRGRRISSAGAGASLPALSRRERRAVAELAARTGRLFGRPQDVEWAQDGDGRLWLLQSRPVTAVAQTAVDGPVLGPGPVAETFPEPLRRLEVELWLAPLREAIVRAMRVTGAVPARQVAASPVVLAVDGWPAADLELLGIRRRTRGWGPLAGLRRLAAAWRVGRLRVALPSLAADLLARVDDHLADVPALGDFTDGDLVTLLENVADELVAVHGYEVLAGMLLADEPGTTPAPALALSVLARAQLRPGSPDGGTATALAADPITLALVPPRFGGTPALPAPPRVPLAPTDARLGVRDALRLRARWLQELGGRAMAVLGEHLTVAGRLTRPDLVRNLSVAELRQAVLGDALPGDLAERAAHRPGPPLPTAFRLTPSGAVVATRRSAGQPEGLAAGGGRAVGRVRHVTPVDGEEHGGVLVVPTLEPSLATVLPTLAGLVSETGSALSHLAILARELGVATVVAVPDARKRFPAGSRVVVDGLSGEVRILPDAEEASP